jgi:RNA polymerase sigma factor for flagellar operon FliA
LEDVVKVVTLFADREQGSAAAAVENFPPARHCFRGYCFRSDMTNTSAGGAQGIVESTAAFQCAESMATDSTDMNRLVRTLAARVLAGLPRDSGIEMSDLIQAGNVGLLQATRTFSPESGVPLAGYAKFRIRGEMLDAVRRSWASGRGYTTIPGADTDDSPGMESVIPASAEHSPHNVLAKSQRAAILGEEVARLPPRYRTVVRLRYAREFSLREIGSVLSVRESRACQLHRSALSRLRQALSRRGLRCMSTLM